jgi:hypothetical protein
VFGSTILEVIIGMLFVYLLLSLLCSAIGEYLESKRNNRAKLLQKGIELLLNDTSGPATTDLAKQFYAHGLIRPLYRDAKTLPSYIPSRTFALALWNMATAGGSGVTTDLREIRKTVANLPQLELRTALLTLIDEANGDLDRARANIEDWYESAMDRVSGWYKRKTAYTMLTLGIVVSAAINADTINLATALARNSALRSAVVSAAERRMAASSPPGGQEQQKPPAGTADAAAREAAAAQAMARAHGDVKALGLPIGWKGSGASDDDLRRVPGTFMDWLLKVVGVLLTGFAVSQGAPFWFDLLNKVIVVRSTVKPKEKSAEQPSKDRPAPRTEVEAGGEKPPAKG